MCDAFVLGVYMSYTCTQVVHFLVHFSCSTYYCYPNLRPNNNTKFNSNSNSNPILDNHEECFKCQPSIEPCSKAQLILSRTFNLFLKKKTLTIFIEMRAKFRPHSNPLC